MNFLSKKKHFLHVDDNFPEASLPDVTFAVTTGNPSVVLDAATTNPTASPSVELDCRAVDLEEEQKVTKFHKDICGCKLVNGGPCSASFTKEDLCAAGNQCFGLDDQSLDYLLMGQIMAGTSTQPQQKVNGPNNGRYKYPATTESQYKVSLRRTKGKQK